MDGTTVQLNEANHFEAEWKDLPETSADGDVYSYYAKEVNDPAVTGYRAEYGAVEAAADGTMETDDLQHSADICFRHKGLEG